jgi:hypothetical protein
LLGDLKLSRHRRRRKLIDYSELDRVALLVRYVAQLRSESTAQVRKTSNVLDCGGLILVQGGHLDRQTRKCPFLKLATSQITSELAFRDLEDPRLGLLWRMTTEAVPGEEALGEGLSREIERYFNIKGSAGQEQQNVIKALAVEVGEGLWLLA